MTRPPSLVFVYGDESVARQFAPSRYRDCLDIELYTDPVDALAGIGTTGPCALVACDLRFPSMMGLDFLLRVRERHQGVKTLVFGAPSDFPALLRARHHGVDAYILKSLVPLEKRSFPTVDLLLSHWAADHGDDAMKQAFPVPRHDPRLRVRQVQLDELERSLAVVSSVYGEELGLLGDASTGARDPFDDHAVHFLATYDGEPIGSARGIVYRPGSGTRLPMESKFDLSPFKSEPLVEAGRFAIVKAHRGGPTSSAMLYGMLMWASRNGIAHLVNASRPALADYYEELGFRAYQPPAINHERKIAAVPMHMVIDDLDIRFQKLLAVPHPNVDPPTRSAPRG